MIDLGPLPDVIQLRLLVKYETISALRLSRSMGEPHPPRTYYQWFAAEFPGALKELDRLPPDLLEQRIVALTTRQLDELDWPWPVAVYHALLAEPDRAPWAALPEWLRAPAQPLDRSRMRSALLTTAQRLELALVEVETRLFPWKRRA